MRKPQDLRPRMIKATIFEVRGEPIERAQLGTLTAVLSVRIGVPSGKVLLVCHLHTRVDFIVLSPVACRDLKYSLNGLARDTVARRDQSWIVCRHPAKQYAP